MEEPPKAGETVAESIGGILVERAATPNKD
jgi:hypothetical protein